MKKGFSTGEKAKERKARLKPDANERLRALTRYHGDLSQYIDDALRSADLNTLVVEEIRATRHVRASTSHAGKMIMTVFAGIAEFERDLIRERTAAGRMVAKRNGCTFRAAPKAESAASETGRDRRDLRGPCRNDLPT